MKYWMSPAPTHCDLCHQVLKDKFIDGNTQMGQWATMCVACHRYRGGVGLGLGRGQLYELKTLLKLEG